MATKVEEYAQKGSEFIQQVAKQLGDPDDTAQAGRVTLSVLHTLRDILSPEASLHFIAQLPLYIKAAYADGWKISEPGVKVDSQELLMESLRSQNNSLAQRDFSTTEDGWRKVEAVFTVLKKYVSQSEINHVLRYLPPRLVQTEGSQPVKPEYHAEL